MEFYSYLHIYINRRVCRKGRYQREGYVLYWKMRLCFPCRECGTPTDCIYGMCVKHARKYRNKANHWKKKNVECQYFGTQIN